MKRDNNWLWTVGIVAAIFTTGALIAFRMISKNVEKREELSKQPKVYGPDDVLDQNMVDPLLRNTDMAHVVGDFQFVDQVGDTVTSEIIDGKIFVVDYFFTTCATICPKMSHQMTRVNEAFKHEEDVAILSHTVWPEVDSVPLMQVYAEEHGAKPKKWFFLTGDKGELYRMARQSYFILKPAEVEGEGDGESDFIHTDQFVLVDKDKRIRGYYSGTDPNEVANLMDDIRYLLDHE